MFLFSDVIEQLETAEASLNSIVNREGIIVPDKYNKVIGFLNTALSDLYTRFNMVKGQCIIATTEGKHSYTLDKENAASVNPTGFIKDTAEFPFTDTVLEITGVSTLDNRPLLFNVMDTFDRQGSVTNDKTYSIDNCVRAFNSPKYRVLRTPIGLRDSELKVSYKAGHTPFNLIEAVDLPSFNPDSLAIDLPYPFLMPIVFYICSRVNNARGSERMGQSTINEGSSFFAKYLSECKTLKENMSQATETTTPADTFSMRGFV